AANCPQPTRLTITAAMTAQFPTLAVAFCLTLAASAHADPETRLVPIGAAFAGNDINVVSFRQSSLTSVVAGDKSYQFAAYYRDEPGPRPNRRVTIARRLIDTAQWQIFDQPFGDDNSNGTDS